MPFLKDHLQATQISHIWKAKNEVITVKSNLSIQEASKILAEKNILSAPVFDPESESWLGFVDMFDIVVTALSIYSEAPNFRAEEAKWSSWCRDIDTLNHRGVRFAIKPVKSVMNMSGNDPLFTVNVNGTVSQLIEEIFCKGVHRVAVMDENMRRPIGIISQSDIIKFLASEECLRLMGNLKSKTVQELNLGTQNVVQMSSSAQAIHAFYLMYFHKVSAIAIVNNGVLVGNLSNSDIRGITANTLSSLLQGVMEYLPQRSKAVVTCTLNSTLESVLLKMAMFRLHRVWIVDEKEHPVGVISTSDIMRAAFLQPK